jgi:hypothetical protein
MNITEKDVLIYMHRQEAAASEALGCKVHLLFSTQTDRAILCSESSPLLQGSGVTVEAAIKEFQRQLPTPKSLRAEAAKLEAEAAKLEARQ